MCHNLTNVLTIGIVFMFTAADIIFLIIDFQGTTRLMLTKIPFFKEVVLMSFYCDKCHFKNAEIQSAGRVQEMGVRYKLSVQNTEVRNSKYTNRKQPHREQTDI